MDITWFANSRTPRGGRRVETTWEAFASHFKEPTPAAITVEKYQSLSDVDAGKVKDYKPYVPGTFKDNRRAKACFETRQVITLDADSAPGFTRFQKRVTGALPGAAYLIHSTISHTEDFPKFRLLIPLIKPVDGYTAEYLARWISDQIGGNYFDWTGVQPSRLMYSPKKLIDGEYHFHLSPGRWLEIPELFPARETWPKGPIENTDLSIPYNTMPENPTVKSGPVGAFCRAYRPEDAIAEFLSDIYEETDSPGRYNLISGSGKSGLVVFNEHFCYSHHSTDPSNDGHAHNAFDLVRIHLFGHLDSDYWDAPGVPGSPSWDTMAAKVDTDFRVESEVMDQFDTLEEGTPHLNGAAQPDKLPDEHLWLEPESLLPPLPDPMAFNPEKLLPEPLRDFVVETAKQMDVDQDFIAAPLVSSMSSMLAGGAVIKPKHEGMDWTIVPNLWGVIVGDPAAMKSPAIDAAIAPLKEINRPIKEAYNVAKQEYEEKKKEHAARVSSTKRRVRELEDVEYNEIEDDKDKTGLAEGNATDKTVKLLNRARRRLEMHGDAPTPPVNNKLIINDATIEALQQLGEGRRRCIFYLCDELDGMFKTFKKENRQADRGYLNTAWNGKNEMEVERKTTKGASVERVMASIFGGIQPSMVGNLLKNTATENDDDGFFQRFQLGVFPKPRVHRYVDIAADPGIYERVKSILTDFYHYRADDFKTAGGEIDPDHPTKAVIFRFTPEANARFCNWFDHNEKRAAKEHTQLMNAHLSKYRKLVPAIALLFHLVEVIDDLDFAERDGVSLKSLEYAISWAVYLETHARRIYALANAPDDRSVYRAAGILQGDPCTVPDGVAFNALFQDRLLGTKDKDEIRFVVRTLQRKQWVRVFEKPVDDGSGKVTRHLYINPKLEKIKSDQSSDSETTQ